MRVYVSYSSDDKATVKKIIDRLRADGHDVLEDGVRRPGENIEQKIIKKVEDSDALILVVSENSTRSRSTQQEFSLIVLQQISRQQQRIIPVKIDHAAVPSYVAHRAYLDLSRNFEAGLARLSQELYEVPSDAPSTSVEHIAASIGRQDAHIERLRGALRGGRLTLVCGAGVSVAAGIPVWDDLLGRLLESMMRRISENKSLDLGTKAASEFKRRHSASALILGKYLKNNLGKDFVGEVRAALYSSQPTTSAIIDSIVELARPQRDAKPLESIINFNFDGLIEERLASSSIKNKPIFSESIKHDGSELPIYHVHGYLPRGGRIPANMDIVFSEDAYHSQFIDPFSWSNLIQLNKLTQNVCLFVGISLTDPNMRRLLDVAWRKSPDKSMVHYIIKRTPQSGGGDSVDELTMFLEEQDANALGLNVVWIEDFGDIPRILRDIASD